MLGKIVGIKSHGSFVEITIGTVHELFGSAYTKLNHTIQIPSTEFDEEKYRLYREVEILCSLVPDKPILNG